MGFEAAAAAGAIVATGVSAPVESAGFCELVE
jgi:hypothetical protein